MKVKYVIVNQVFPRLGSLGEEHADIAGGRNVTSAGFCSFSGEGLDWSVTCWGQSIGLGIKSDPEHDANRIKRMLEG